MHLTISQQRVRPMDRMHVACNQHSALAGTQLGRVQCVSPVSVIYEARLGLSWLFCCLICCCDVVLQVVPPKFAGAADITTVEMREAVSARHSSNHTAHSQQWLAHITDHRTHHSGAIGCGHLVRPTQPTATPQAGTSLSTHTVPSIDQLPARPPNDCTSSARPFCTFASQSHSAV